MVSIEEKINKIKDSLDKKNISMEDLCENNISNIEKRIYENIFHENGLGNNELFRKILFFKTEICQLQELLKNEQFDFTFEELIYLLEHEKILQDYNKFKNKMFQNNPQKLEEYISNFLDIYGEHYQNYIVYFKKLLDEKQNNIQLTFLLDLIEKIKKEKETLIFKKKLFSSPISINDLDTITGYEFEAFLKKLFEKMGCTVEQTSLSKDQGADLVISRFGEKMVIQAKRYSGKVSNAAIQEVVASIKFYNADKGMVVTTNYFTDAAIELAKANNILLVDRTKLEELIKKYL